MSESERDLDNFLPLELAREIDRVCDEFAAKLKAGSEPRIEDFLGRLAESGRGALLRELMVMELEYLIDRGKSPAPKAYCSRFPDDRPAVDAAFDRLKEMTEAPPEAGSANKPPAPDRGFAGSASHNLLFGIIALQNDFVTREALVAGFDAWVHDKSRTLAEILQGQEALSADDREVLDRLIAKFLQKHGGDPEKSLAALSSVTHVRPELDQFDDADLSVSLGHVGDASSADPRFTTTALFSQQQPRGRFRILRPHAKGGLGQVSVALDQDLNREVALKEIQPKHADDATARERFLLEAEITGALEHPGIVPVYALGHGPDGRPFYAMRFVKGDSLKQAIEDFHKPDQPHRQDPGARQLALRQLLGRFIDVCNAMEYAHSRGVLHRDLKPGNIMVGKYGETLVVDWGLAKSVGKKEIVSDEGTLRPSSALSSSGQTQPGSAIGTPAYMSPEQAAGKLGELGPASDVYSLGATLYHLLCGKPPFEGKDPVEVVSQVNRGDFARPRQVSSTIPPPLEAICLQAMALHAADRYPTARALADDLEHWLADEPVTAMPDRVGDRLRRFGRRHRGAVRAAAVAVILLAAVSTVAALFVNESRKTSVELARKNGNLASENSKLADSERTAKNQAQKLADVNGLLARDERDARLATERQLRIAKAERLAALSHAKRSESPEISLALAVESGRATSMSNAGVLASSHQALLDSLGNIGGCPLVGHNDRITSVAISPDGHWVVTASHDNTIRTWDLTAENPAASPRVFQGGELGETIAVAVTADSRSIVVAKYGDLRIWDLSTDPPSANPRVRRGEGGMCRCVAISSDSRLVAMGSGKEALVWDLTAEGPAAGPRILAGHTNLVTSVAISPDSRWIVTVSEDATARLWDLAADDPGASPRILGEHGGSVAKVAISPDGNWIVTAGGDNTARVWNLRGENPGDRPIVLSGHEAVVTSLAMSPDGHWVVTGSWDRTARVWDLRSSDPGANPCVLTGHSGPVRCLAISPDGRSIVTGSADKTARVWDLTAENPAANPRVLTAHQGEIHSVAISPDSRWVVTGADDNSPRLWDLQEERFVTTPRVLRVAKPHMISAAISPDSRWIVTASEHGAKAWDLEHQNRAERDHNLPDYQGVVWSVAISPDSRWVVAGCLDNTARVWELAAADRDNPRLLTGHKADVYSVAISPDGRWLLTGSGDKTARLWDMMAEDPAANALVLTGHANPVRHTLFSPDGRWGVTISIGAADEVRVWDLRAADAAANPLVIPTKTSRAVFSPDSRWLVSGGDNKVRIWDLHAPDPVSSPRILTGHEFGIAAIAISSDGRWLVTGGLDRTVRVWDLAADDPSAGAQILSGHQGSVTSVAISPDGGWIASGGFDQTLRLWEATPANRSFTSRVLRGHDSMINGVLISPDSHRIVTWSYDLTARCWTWQWDDLVEMARVVGRNLSKEEWRQSFPDEEYRMTFPDRPIPGDPRTAIDYVVRGTRRRWLNEIDAAIGDFTAAIGLDRNIRSAYMERAEIRALQGQTAEALRDYSEAIRLDPTRASAYNDRAWILATANDAQFRDAPKAIADATQACELTSWKNWRFLDTLAAAYAEAGNFADAVKWQTESIATAPDDEKPDLNVRLELYRASKPYRAMP